MNPDIGKALIVLVVGMITVFVILSLVVITGHTLIRFVNRFFPGQEKLRSHKIKQAPVFEDIHKLPKNKIAAIIASVEAMNMGNGKITRIEKI